MFHVKRFLILSFFIPCFSFSQHMGTTILEVKELPGLPKQDVAVDSFLNRYPETALLGVKQREWFYWTNYSRSNPARFWDSVVSPILAIYPNFRNTYTNSLKTDLYNAKALPYIKPNKALASTAQQLANELAEKGSLPSHTSPSGVTFQQRMQQAGIKICA